MFGRVMLEELYNNKGNNKEKKKRQKKKKKEINKKSFFFLTCFKQTELLCWIFVFRHG